MSEEIKETSTGELEQGEFKLKKKPKKLANKKPEETVKVDLSKKEETPKIEIKEDAIPESSTTKVDVRELPKDGGEVGETHTEEPKAAEEKKEEPVATITEITEDVKEEEKVIEDIKEEIKENPKLELPENVEKLVDFMKDTGGTVEDYVRLNADYSSISEEALLNEYHKKTRPHLDPEEVKFLMEDKFIYDEDLDEDRDIRKKKLAKKEEIARAKNFLEETKSKYYDEIKLRPGVTQEQQKAMDFFNRYNKEQEQAEQQHQMFKDNTKKLFSDDFKGFDINVGEKKYKYNIQNVDKVAESQSNITNLVGKFLDENGNVQDVNGYHKAIYAAENVDKIAAHFYEQGKADAVKDVVNKSKNLSDTKARTSQGDVFIDGFKVRAISGADSTKLKIKTKKFN